MPNTREKRLTWKMCIDGYEDVGLSEGVTVGEAICKLADLEERSEKRESLNEQNIFDQAYENLQECFSTICYPVVLVARCIVTIAIYATFPLWIIPYRIHKHKKTGDGDVAPSAGRT